MRQFTLLLASLFVIAGGVVHAGPPQPRAPAPDPQITPAALHKPRNDAATTSTTSTKTKSCNQSGLTTTLKFDHPSVSSTSTPGAIPDGYGKYGWIGWHFSSTDGSLVNPKSGGRVASTNLPTSAAVYFLDQNGVYAMGLSSFYFGCSFYFPQGGGYAAQSCGVMVVAVNDNVDGGGSVNSYGPYYFTGYEGHGDPPDFYGYNMTKAVPRAYGQYFYFVVTYAEFGSATLYVDDMVLSRPDPNCF